MWGWRACVLVLGLCGGACGAAHGPLRPPTEFPDRAQLMAVAEEMSRAWRASVRGGVLLTNTLRHLDFPPELLSSSPLHLALAITHVKLPGTTWGAYVVLFVIVDRAVTTATAPHRPARG